MGSSILCVCQQASFLDVADEAINRLHKITAFQSNAHIAHNREYLLVVFLRHFDGALGDIDEEFFWLIPADDGGGKYVEVRAGTDHIFQR